MNGFQSDNQFSSTVIIEKNLPGKQKRKIIETLEFQRLAIDVMEQINRSLII